MSKNITKPLKNKIDWDAVDSVPESDYNYDDAPEATLEFFKSAYIRVPNKTKPITMRIKADTLDFFKQKASHYQTLINNVLDAYVEAHKKQKLAH